MGVGITENDLYLLPTWCKHGVREGAVGSLPPFFYHNPPIIN